MTYMITCSRCQAGFDLLPAYVGGSGAIYIRPLRVIPLCANCIDEIVFEHLEREEEV